MYRIILISLSVMALRVAGAPIQNPSNGHWYEVVGHHEATWTEQRAYVASLPKLGDLYPHLATFSSRDEEQFIWGQLPEADSKIAIGLHDPTDTGAFIWVTGEPLTFGAPSPATSGDPAVIDKPGDFPHGPNGGNPWGENCPSADAGVDFVGIGLPPEPRSYDYLAWRAYPPDQIFGGYLVEYDTTPDLITLPEPGALVAVVFGATTLLLRRSRRVRHQ